MKIRTKLQRWLTQKLPVAVVSAITLLVAGCGPEDWIVWAPDGTHGVARDGTARLIDSAGNTVASIAGEKESFAAWLPDSRRVLVVRSVNAASWEEYAALLGADRTAVVAAAGAELARIIAENPQALAEFDETPGFKNWNESLDSRGLEIETVMFFLDATRPGLLDPLMEAIAKKESVGTDTGAPAKTAATLREEIGAPQIRELRVRSVVGSGISDDALLFRCADEIGAFVVSPSGRALAFIRVEATDPRLYVMELEPDAQPMLVETGAESAAWSPDGLDLAYSKSTVPRRIENKNGGLAPGSIARRRVCTADGAVIPDAEAGEDLAGLILPEYPARVAWLRDGRIVFAGAKYTLPATTQNLPGGLTLFALRLQPAPSIEQLIADSVPARLTERANFFTVSPDGRNIAVLGNAGAVSVLSFDTGTFATFQDSSPQFAKKGNDGSMLVPTWRSADELTFLVPPGDPAGTPARAEVVIGSLRGGKRAISKSWPDSAKLPALEK